MYLYLLSDFIFTVVADEKVKEVTVGGESGVSSPGMKQQARAFRAEVSASQTTNTSMGASGTSSPAAEPSEKLASRPAAHRTPPKSRDFESGVSTPERPVHYCEEGTPGDCISRVSSLSSLSGGKESTKVVLWLCIKTYSTPFVKYRDFKIDSLTVPATKL